MTYNFFKFSFPTFEKIEQNSELKPFWSYKDFVLDLPKKWDLSLAFLTKGVVAGFAITSQKTPFCAHLHRIMISPDWRQHGFARSLLLALKKLCKNQYHFLTLFVDSSNKMLHGFYQKEGFLPVRIEEQKTFMVCIL
jgi:ribosomal protein S18 acetylase RimI-like enzyme